MSDSSTALIDRLQLTPAYQRLTAEGKALLVHMCVSDPVRTVGVGSLMSMSGEFYSDSLGATVQFDSRGGERLFALMAELDMATMLLLDQPTKLRIHAHDVRGRTAWRLVTPDYLECRSSSFSFVEVKAREALRKLVSKYPDDWVQSDDAWRFLPGEHAAGLMGFGYRIFDADAYSKAFQTNVLFRWRVKQAAPESLTDKQLGKLRALLKHGPRSVASLSAHGGRFTGGQLLQAIERGHLFGLLDLQIFEGSFLVFGSAQDVLEHRARFEPLAIPEQPMGQYLERLLRASKKEWEYAAQRLAQYEADRRANIPPNSTAYKQQVRLREVAKERAPRIAAFIPNFKGRGGTGRPVDGVIAKSIVKETKAYLCKTKGKRSPAGALARWEKKHPEYRDKISDETFRKLYHRENAPERIALISGGARGFHQARPRTDGRHANPRPQIAGLQVHLDGVYADAMAIGEQASFERPIYFPMVDDQTGYVLSRGVRTNRPNTQAVNMAICDCVMRHGFLPAVILRDKGSENDNNMSPEMAAALRPIFETRPRAAARFGGMGENFNTHFNKYAQQLEGGMYFDAAGRSADGSKKGRKHARYQMEEMVRRLDHWIFEEWNKDCPNDGAHTREELFLMSLRLFPEAVVSMQDGSLLRYHTGYPLKGKADDTKRGIRYAGRAYSSVDLVNAIRLRRAVSAPRLDSLDPSVIWVDDGDHYISAHSLDHARVQGQDFGQRVVLYHEMACFESASKVNRKARRRSTYHTPEDLPIQEINAEQPQAFEVTASDETASRQDVTTTQWPEARVRLVRLGER